MAVLSSMGRSVCSSTRTGQPLTRPMILSATMRTRLPSAHITVEVFALALVNSTMTHEAHFMVGWYAEALLLIVVVDIE
jgi:hypothetical protein